MLKQKENTFLNEKLEKDIKMWKDKVTNDI
jgi:hypothetical protein